MKIEVVHSLKSTPERLKKPTNDRALWTDSADHLWNRTDCLAPSITAPRPFSLLVQLATRIHNPPGFQNLNLFPPPAPLACQHFRSGPRLPPSRLDGMSVM